ncbi:MAG TPA: tetratricopeptide repeat protein [Anaerolineales bacterium]|nr:tetratricopeptide repeat protein [Anaerolineales bacterium]HMX19856.1 tetratricopeptide repeat protein [Anaerolineales bacterium]HMX76238.1 tetratricopeptide repeat protein [Anaerolineales bacterium]HMZ42080.1 tetratricopeptide repeat protein [Anaerolineales bacterium]HNA53610.1 tetratricopeptide repeat protein [Anaerolineales bacterium]
MKHYRKFIILVMFALQTVSPVKAQEGLQFEGTIAFISTDGNIVLATGDGRQVRITADAGTMDPETGVEVTYDYLSFSPDGAYLAFDRDGYTGIGDGVFVYDVLKGEIVRKFSFEEVGLPVLWHKDSDSFIDSEIDPSNDYQRNYYRQFITGEREGLFQLVEGDNGYVINFDLGIVIYTEGNSQIPTFYDWANNQTTNLQINGLSASANGFWSPDKRLYVHTGDEKVYSLINLDSGSVYKKIEIFDILPPREHTFPTGETYNLTSVEVYDLNQEGSRLLLSDDLYLYELNLDTESVETVYTSRLDNPDSRLYGFWSGSGRVILIDEYLAGGSFFDGVAGDQSLLVVEKGFSPTLVADDAEALFWLSGDSDQFLYKKYTQTAQQVSVELMLFDYPVRESFRVGDLPTFHDISYDPYILNFIVDWTQKKIDLTENTLEPPLASPVPPNFSIEGTPISGIQQNSQPSLPLPSGISASSLFYGGICCLLLAILLVIIAVFLSRSRKRKNTQSHPEDQPQFVNSASGAEQVKQAIELAKAKQYHEAFEILEGVIKTEPNNVAAWFNLGRVFASMGNLKDAERCFLQARKLGHPKANEALIWLKKKSQ